MTPEQRKQLFADWVRQGEVMFGVTIPLPEPLTILPNGGFVYTPVKQHGLALIEGWQPPAPPEEGKPE